MNENELLNLKKKIDIAKSSVAELTGRKNYLMQELKETWQCKSIKEAQNLLDKFQADIKKISEALESAVIKIKETYDV
jgi:hypothetical protein